MLETLLQFCYLFYENFSSIFPVCTETLGPLDTYGLIVQDQPPRSGLYIQVYNTFRFKKNMDRYSARTTSHIQNKETVTHERNTELTYVGRSASSGVRGDIESKGAN